MHILIGIGLAAALLYFWLLGHWFARVLVFLMLAVVVFFMACATASPEAAKADPAGVIILGLVFAPIAWPIASIPLYYWQRRFRRLMAAGR
jgi:uncharacterized membrane protein YccC